MIKHIINSSCMKGMTCQISRDSWSAGLNLSVVILQLKTQHQLRHTSQSAASKATSSIFQKVLFLWFQHPNIPGTRLWFISMQRFKTTTSGLYLTAKLTLRPKHRFTQKPKSCISPQNHNKFNNYMSLREDNYSPTCQMNNFVCLTTK